MFWLLNYRWEATGGYGEKGKEKMATRKQSWDLFLEYKVGKACCEGGQKQEATRLKYLSMSSEI